MTALLHDLDQGTYQVPSKITVSEWMDEWLNTFCKNKLKPQAYQSYVGIIKNHIKPIIGCLRVQNVNGVHIQGIYNAMIQAGRSNKTVKNVSGVLHKSFDSARKQGIIQTNPCDLAETPKAVRPEINPLTDKEICLFLKAIEASPMRNAYALCLLAGLREGECLGLSWKQVDFEKSRITVSQQLQKPRGKGYCIVTHTKSDKPRMIELPSVALKYLWAEKVKQQENRIRAGPAWSNADDLVFTNEVGKHYAISTFYKGFKRIAASIGRPDARPHDLRHTAATVAIASGADIKSVQDLLGHATASFTLNVYAHTSEQMMKDTAEKVQGYYDQVSQDAGAQNEVEHSLWGGSLNDFLDLLIRLIEDHAETVQEAVEVIRQFKSK